MPISCVEIKRQRCLPGKMKFRGAARMWEGRRYRHPRGQNSDRGSPGADHTYQSLEPCVHLQGCVWMPLRVHVMCVAVPLHSRWRCGNGAAVAQWLVLPALVSFPFCLSLVPRLPCFPSDRLAPLPPVMPPHFHSYPSSCVPCGAPGLTWGCWGSRCAGVPGRKTGVWSCNPCSEEIRPWKGRKLQLLSCFYLGRSCNSDLGRFWGISSLIMVSYERSGTSKGSDISIISVLFLRGCSAWV